MQWDFKSDRPIYTQLMEQISLGIVSGEYPAGSKLPSVRDMAEIAKVNPNTVQKALAELEREGLVFSQRTSGRFITEDKAMIDSTQNKFAAVQIQEFLQKMQQLGYEKLQVIQLIHDSEKGAAHE